MRDAAEKPHGWGPPVIAVPRPFVWAPWRCAGYLEILKLSAHIRGIMKIQL